MASVEMSCSTQKQVVFIATVPFPQNKNNGLLLESPALLSTMYSQPKFHCFIHLKQKKQRGISIENCIEHSRSSADVRTGHQNRNSEFIVSVILIILDKLYIL